MGYGIGRIPAAVDPTAEAMAELKAMEMQPRPRQLKRCSACGRQTSELMTSSQGSVCPDCYDRCSD